MNVVTGHHVVEQHEPKALASFEQPLEIRVAVACEPEEKLPLMTAMRDVPDVTWHEMTVSSRHLNDRRESFSAWRSLDRHHASAGLSLEPHMPDRAMQILIVEDEP